MFIQKDDDVSFLQKLDDELGPELSILASGIGDSFELASDLPRKEVDFHFIYYNPVSLSIKSSFMEQIGFTALTLPTIPLAVYK